MENETSTEPTPDAAPGTDIHSGRPADPMAGMRDPRIDFAEIAGPVAGLIERIEADAEQASEILAGTTPCPEFTVEALLDHVVMVMRRIAALGAGRHFSTVEQTAVGSGWAKAYREALTDIERVWADDRTLGTMYEVPWGEFPGAAVMAAYCTEIGVHGWDLATATGKDLVIPEVALSGALTAARFIPAEGRDAEVPFGPVIDPGPDAPLFDQLAGWLGRPVVG